MLVRGFLVIAEKLKAKSIISCIATEIEGLSLAVHLSLELLVWVVFFFFKTLSSGFYTFTEKLMVAYENLSIGLIEP